MQRSAQCVCGAVRLTVAGEPTGGVVACHCIDCQRRSGSPFGVGAYFACENVRVHGTTQEFVRPTEAGNAFHTFFCPVYGTSTHWTTTRSPEFVGVAVGAFGDPAFAQPTRSVWERSKHAWVDVPCAQQHFAKGRDGPPSS